MKIRLGFVSNSSSSSFCIGKNYMTPEQIEAFRNLLNQADDEDEDYDEETCIGETKLYFVGELSMHNSKVTDFLDSQGLGNFYATYC